MAHQVPEVFASDTPNLQTFDDRSATVDRPPGEERASVSLLPSNDFHSPAIRVAWDEWVANSGNIDVLFQSPLWFDHIAATDVDKRLAMAVARHADGHIQGLAPLIRG